MNIQSQSPQFGGRAVATLADVTKALGQKGFKPTHGSVWSDGARRVRLPHAKPADTLSPGAISKIARNAGLGNGHTFVELIRNGAILG
jgi:predicted RNA binding protein YcfA (HicA-like mRNA interferase family)